MPGEKFIARYSEFLLIEVFEIRAIQLYQGQDTVRSGINIVDQKIITVVLFRFFAAVQRRRKVVTTEEWEIGASLSLVLRDLVRWKMLPKACVLLACFRSKYVRNNGLYGNITSADHSLLLYTSCW